MSVYVVGKSRVLLAPRTVTAKAFTAKASGRRCAVAAATPLAALAAADHAGGPAFRVRDLGHCSRSRAADSTALFVDRVGKDRNHGTDGWEYKVGNKAGSTSAADPSGATGNGRRLRRGDHVTWFWCVLSASTEQCQRTLVVSAPASATPGGAVRATVRGYDDGGHGRAISGATVTLGGQTGTTGADGRVTLTAPASAGRVKLSATHAGMVPAAPRSVRVR